MEKRTIGTSEIAVAPVMFGGNVFGWTVDEAASFHLLDAWVDRGFDFIDTADVYSRWAAGNSGGESETILGRWFAQSGKRDRVVLATKAGKDMGEGRTGLSAAYLERAVEASLRRLQTDCIDLYQAHADDETVPLEETLTAFDRMVRAGKVRLLGASNYTGARLAEAIGTSNRLGLAAYVTLQPNYNLHAREEYERDLAPVAAQHGLGVIPYFSLAAGFLTGKYRTAEDAKGTQREGMVRKYFDERGGRILEALVTVAEETRAPQASVALAWLLAQPNILAPIASATSAKQLEALFLAAELTLTPEQLARLDVASRY